MTSEQIIDIIKLHHSLTALFEHPNAIEIMETQFNNGTIFDFIRHDVACDEDLEMFISDDFTPEVIAYIEGKIGRKIGDTQIFGFF